MSLPPVAADGCNGPTGRSGAGSRGTGRVRLQAAGAQLRAGLCGAVRCRQGGRPTGRAANPQKKVPVQGGVVTRQSRGDRGAARGSNELLLITRTRSSVFFF